MAESALVLESFYTVSGRVFAALRYTAGQLAVGTTLRSEIGSTWAILDNHVKLGPESVYVVLSKPEEGLYLYELRPIGHTRKPDGGQSLTVVS